MYKLNWIDFYYFLYSVIPFFVYVFFSFYLFHLLPYTDANVLVMVVLTKEVSLMIIWDYDNVFTFSIKRIVGTHILWY